MNLIGQRGNPNRPVHQKEDLRDRGGKAQPMLIAENLRKYFPIRSGVLQRKIGEVKAVDGVSFAVLKGETLGVVGESGCGKSTLARVLMHLLPRDLGELIFDGDPIGGPRGLSLRELRRNMQMVFQDSHSSLNPRLPILDSIAYGPRVHGMPRAQAKDVARGLLHQVGLRAELFGARYPHELSGGQKQRVNIARALALSPRMLILDEAVSALDKSVEAQVLNLLSSLKRQFNLTYLFISHDLSVVRYISDRVLVMYLGEVVEIGPVDAIYNRAKHPYSKALLDSRLAMDPSQRLAEPPIFGDPPSPIDPPSGCRFRTRCPYAEAICAHVAPKLGAGDHDAHLAACHMVNPHSGHSQAGLSLVERPPYAGTVTRQDPKDMIVSADQLGGPLSSSPAFVEVRDLSVKFVSREATTSALNGVSFSVTPGEVLCIIGESGSGKSVMMRALMHLLPPKRTVIDGHIRVGDVNILAANERQLSALRGAQASMIFQEPMTALDPVYTIGDQIAETIMRHEGCSKHAALQRALELLQLVKIPLPERRLKALPHELSGGLRQRAMIAMALSCQPRLLLADEPTTALDATVQIQLLVLLRKLQEELGMAIIFVTHDLGVAAQIADKVAVMYAGRIVEYGAVQDVLRRPSHPYTLGMLASTVHGQPRGKDIVAIAGSPPDLRRSIPGCSFAPRCRFAISACLKAQPPTVVIGGSHSAACIRISDLNEQAAPPSTNVSTGTTRVQQQEENSHA